MQPLAATKRRWLALMCLGFAWAMTNWGCLVLQRVLRGWGFAVYWLICVTLAAAAVALALVDLFISWRAYRTEKARCQREQQEAAEQDMRGD
jgi:uncharacterized membrane protein